MSEVSIKLPRRTPNDTVARLVAWVAPDGAIVRAGEVIAVFESTKAAYEVEAPADGYLLHSCSVGETAPIGDEIGVVASSPERRSAPARKDETARTVTQSARELMTLHGLTDADLPSDLDPVTSASIQRLLGAARTAAPAVASWEAVLEKQEPASPRDLSKLRTQMRASFNRHVPLGTLLNDRWRLAREMAFGKGSSVYDESLIIGDVRVGENCWIGPFTVLDGGAAPLTIGAWTSIGAGAQLYTHHTIDQALSGGAAAPSTAATTIGRCCFVSPLAMVGPGSTIGDHSFIAAHSFVQGAFPPFSYIGGAPAQLIGRVQIDGAQVRLDLDRQVT